MIGAHTRVVVSTVGAATASPEAVRERLPAVHDATRKTS